MSPFARAPAPAPSAPRSASLSEPPAAGARRGAVWQLWLDRGRPIPTTLAPLALDAVVMVVLLTAVMFNCLRANEEVRLPRRLQAAPRRAGPPGWLLLDCLMVHSYSYNPVHFIEY